MKKRQVISLLLSLVLFLSLLSFGAEAVSRPVSYDDLHITTSGSAYNATGWYRFAPTEDALYHFWTYPGESVITVYQSKLAPSEFAYTDSQIAEAEKALEAERSQIAEWQQQYDDGVALLEDNRDAYNRGVKMLEENRQKYEEAKEIMSRTDQPPFEVQELVAEYESALVKLQQYEDAERQIADAKVQLEQAYAQIAEDEAKLNALRELLGVSKQNQSGELWECESYDDYSSYWLMAKGSEYFLQLGNRKDMLRYEKICSAFQDIPDDAYYFDPVYWAAANEITQGTSKGYFSPDMTCTRAHVVTFLWRAAGSPTVLKANPFVDVDASAYYYKAVLWASSRGITQGNDRTHFSPDVPCTRAQIVTFLWRFFDSPPQTGFSSFTDVSQGEYYLQPVIWAVNNDITYGTDRAHRYFSPDAPCTRAQVVTFLFRCI